MFTIKKFVLKYLTRIGQTRNIEGVIRATDSPFILLPFGGKIKGESF